MWGTAAPTATGELPTPCPQGETEAELSGNPTNGEWILGKVLPESDPEDTSKRGKETIVLRRRASPGCSNH